MKCGGTEGDLRGKEKGRLEQALLQITQAVCRGMGIIKRPRSREEPPLGRERCGVILRCAPSREKRICSRPYSQV